MAEREQLHEGARDLRRTLHLAPQEQDTDPEAMILELVRTQARIVGWLREEVSRLDADALVRGARLTRRSVTTTGQFPGETTTTEVGAQEHLLSQMYARERRIYADVLAKAIAAGVARRHVELAEQQGELAGRLITGVLAEMGVDPGSPRAQEVIRRQFALLAGGAAS